MKTGATRIQVCEVDAMHFKTVMSEYGFENTERMFSAVMDFVDKSRDNGNFPAFMEKLLR